MPRAEGETHYPRNFWSARRLRAQSYLLQLREISTPLPRRSPSTPARAPRLEPSILVSKFTSRVGKPLLGYRRSAVGVSDPVVPRSPLHPSIGREGGGREVRSSAAGGTSFLPGFFYCRRSELCVRLHNGNITEGNQPPRRPRRQREERE